MLGSAIGLPIAVLAGPVWGKFISRKIYLEPPPHFDNELQKVDPENHPQFRLIAVVISIPLLLILVNTFTGVAVSKGFVPQSAVSYTHLDVYKRQVSGLNLIFQKKSPR